MTTTIDFRNAANNRFLAVRELKIQGVRVPHYNRRADLVCFVNGLPLVFIELKAVYRNIRAGFDDNLTDYLSEHSIAHAFHHNTFLVVSNGNGRFLPLLSGSTSNVSWHTAWLAIAFGAFDGGIHRLTLPIYRAVLEELCRGGLAFQMPWQIPVGGAIAILCCCLAAGLISIIRVLRVEPAIVLATTTLPPVGRLS